MIILKQIPTIETERLILRAFSISDAKDVQRLAGDKAIVEMTLNIPYPYEDGMAEKWIKTHQEQFNQGELISLAIVHKEDDYLIGNIGIIIDQKNENGELGYWVGKDYWNKGYCTEATKALVEYSFIKIGLNRIYATHFKKNPASGEVMKKIGMSYEGCLRQQVKKWGKFEDLVYYGLLREDYL